MKAIVIGGGIIGCATAWRLASDGAEVTVIERGRLGLEASWAAAGLIAPQAEAHEPGVFFDLAMAGKRAFDGIVERLIEESAVDPEYDRDGVLYAAFDDHSAWELKARAKWQRAAGAEVVELAPRDALKLAPQLSDKIVHALHMPSNRRLDNRKLVQAYVSAAARAGAEFRESTGVDAIETHGGRASGVTTHGGESLSADVVVNAAGTWAGEIRGLEEDKIRMRPVRGQVVCFETRPGLIGPSLFSGDGILIPRRDGRLLAGSVFEEAGFNKSVTMAAMEKILHAAVALVPGLGSLPFREAWAGLRPATADLLPILGPSPSIPNVYYATGHFRSGILLSALTADVIAGLVAGRAPAIDLKHFSPARFRAGNIQTVKIAKAL